MYIYIYLSLSLFIKRTEFNNTVLPMKSNGRKILKISFYFLLPAYVFGGAKRARQGWTSGAIPGPKIRGKEMRGSQVAPNLSHRQRGATSRSLAPAFPIRMEVRTQTAKSTRPARESGHAR
jgi:hypothetical protein